MRFLRQFFFVGFLLTPWLLPTAVQAAAGIMPGEERFFLSTGIFLPRFDTDVRVNNQTLGIGTQIDLQNTLGLEADHTTFYVNAYWRFLPRHRLWVSYSRYDSEASVALQGQLQIGDEIFPIGASLATEFTFQVLPISYSFSFFKNEQFELAAAIGVQWYWIDFKVQGSASLGPADPDTEATASTNIPFPLIGLRFNYHITPRWTARALVEGSSLDLGDDSGALVNLRFGTEYWFFNNFGAGVAVNWFWLDVRLDGSDWRGELEYKYWGPQIYLTARY